MCNTSECKLLLWFVYIPLFVFTLGLTLKIKYIDTCTTSNLSSTFKQYINSSISICSIRQYIRHREFCIKASLYISWASWLRALKREKEFHWKLNSSSGSSFKSMQLAFLWHLAVGYKDGRWSWGRSGARTAGIQTRKLRFKVAEGSLYNSSVCKCIQIHLVYQLESQDCKAFALWVYKLWLTGQKWHRIHMFSANSLILTP